MFRCAPYGTGKGPEIRLPILKNNQDKSAIWCEIFFGKIVAQKLKKTNPDDTVRSVRSELRLFESF